MRCIFSSVLGFLTLGMYAQSLPLSVQQTKELKESSWVKNIPFENITPSSSSVNVIAMEVNNDASEILIIPKQGGVWYSDNSGASFRPIFEEQTTQNITALAVNWTQNIIWIATDEGLYQSSNKGESWTFRGLSSVKNISEILINPIDPKVVLVSAVGSYYGADNQRGIFRTEDNGNSWKQVLNISTQTGVIELKPAQNSDIVYASAWEQNNSLWDTNNAGSKSGIYKSEDYGNTWEQVTNGNNGFPKNDKIGRIGLAVYDKDLLYAVVDNQNVLSETKDTSLEIKQHILLSAEDIDKMSKEAFVNTPNDKLNAFLYTYNLQGKYTAENLKNLIRSNTTIPSKLLSYLGISLQKIKGAEVYKSEDGGKTWQKTHQDLLPDLYYQEGGKFGDLVVNPQNSKELYVGGVALLKSTDSGANWESIYLGDFIKAAYHITISNSGKRLFFSNGQKLLTSYDSGKNWINVSLPSIGKFNNVELSQGNPYKVYLSSDSHIFTSEISSNNPLSYQKKDIPARILKYSQDGRMYTSNPYGSFSEGSWEQNTLNPLVIKNTSKELARYGQKSPIVLSSVNKDILYVGSNKLHLSMNQGKNWRTISEDLTNGDKKGNQAYGTLTTISESPFYFGVIYTGSDDGMVHITQNGGVAWKVIYNAFPKTLSVGKILASQHYQDRAYVILNGEEVADNQPYIFKSEDYGKSLKDLRANLPQVAATTILEDSENSELLYLGTEKGLYISFDAGEKWNLFSLGIPLTGITDIALQPDTKDLWVTTSGMGVYKTNTSYLEKLNAAVQKQVFYSFDEVTKVKYSSQWGNRWSFWQTVESPEVIFHTFSSKDDMQVTVKIYKDDVLLNILNYTLSKGFNDLKYNLTVSEIGKVSYEKQIKKVVLTKATNGKYYLPKGSYKIEFSGDKFIEERVLEVE